MRKQRVIDTFSMDIRKHLISFDLDIGKWENGNKVAGTRARKALTAIKKLAGEAKKEVTMIAPAQPQENRE